MESGTANALYYTFSTFAQTLASAIGFLAAVVLYRIQRIDEELVPHGNDLVGYWPDVAADDPRKEALQAHRSWRRRDCAALLAAIRAYPESCTPTAVTMSGGSRCCTVSDCACYGYSVGLWC